MDSRRKVLARIWLVIEVLFLVLALYALIDTAILAVRSGRGMNLRFVATSLATLVPGALLVKGYLAYARGSDEGRQTILSCVAATAVIFGLSLVPGLKTFLFGLGDIPALQTLYIRLLELTFGIRGSGRIFVIDLVVQALLPLLLLALCEGKDLIQGRTPRDLGFALLRVAGSVLAVWAAYAVTVWLIRSDTFGHSWIIVGFIPIPGQIMLVLPAIVAIAAIVAIWSKK